MQALESVDQSDFEHFLIHSTVNNRLGFRVRIILEIGLGLGLGVRVS